MKLLQLPQWRKFLENRAKRPYAGWPNSAMRLVFSDEAGTGDGTEPILVVAAVVVEGDHQWPLIETVRKNLVETYVREENRATFEFKASRLFAQLGKGNNEILLREFLQIISTFQLVIGWGAIDRAGMRTHYAAENLACSNEVMQDLAFRVVATQIEILMRKFWFTERAIWLADETRANPEMKAGLRQFQVATPFDEEILPKFEHIIDTIFFGSSKISLGIQLADACNFFIKRHLMRDKSAERYFQMIYPFMINRDDSALYSPADRG